MNGGDEDILPIRQTSGARPDLLYFADLATLTAIKARLRERFGIGHATVEMEQDGCADGRHDC